jgi:glutathione S-transferase
MNASTPTPAPSTSAELAAPPLLLPRLYTFRRCPYAMRARMALLQAGQAFEAVEVSLRDKPPSLLALSPKGTVPVLQLPDGRVIDESWDIMHWALLTAAPEAQAQWAQAQTPENLDLLQRNDGAFKRHLDRWKYPQRYVSEGGPSPQQHRDQAVELLLRPLEARLQGAPFLGGARPCASDWALFPFVRQFAAVDPAWFAALGLPALQAWLDGWLASPLFAACMHKLPAPGVHRFAPL